MKKYVIFAGVNGAGKSTLYNTLKLKNTLPRVNSDEIVRSFGDWRNMSDVMKAGKIAVKKIDEYFTSEISFNQETTLCGHTIFKNIMRAKKQGYLVEMFYVGVESSQISKDRIASRVANGGHGIPDEDVDRRYIESLNNLEKAINMCDLVSVYDNSEVFRRIAIYKSGKLCLLSRNVPDWFSKVIGSVNDNETVLD